MGFDGFFRIRVPKYFKHDSGASVPDGIGIGDPNRVKENIAKAMIG